MAWTVSASGTTAALTISTPVTLTTDTTNATYVLKVDLTNMVNGDVVELRILTKVLTGSTLHLMWKGTYAQAPLIIVTQSPFVPSDFSVQFTITQVAGTGRAFDWSVLRQ